MQENWSRAIQFVLDREGAYINHPEDPGGETNFGISKRAYSDLDIKALTKEQAIDIYRRDYWQKASCDRLGSPLDIVVFDSAVNCGIGRATLWLSVTHDWRDYLFMRMAHYASLATAKPFMVGWTRRVVELWRLARGL